MKISKKAIVALCIIIPILALVLSCVWWYNPNLNFSKYSSYKIVSFFYGHDDYEVTLTDEQFQRITDVYKNDKTLTHNGFFDYNMKSGYKLYLYKSNDMSGEFDIMWTGDNGKSGDTEGMCLWIGDKCFPFDKSDTAEQVNAIIHEAIDQYESEQK